MNIYKIIFDTVKPVELQKDGKSITGRDLPAGSTAYLVMVTEHVNNDKIRTIGLKTSYIIEGEFEVASRIWHIHDVTNNVVSLRKNQDASITTEWWSSHDDYMGRINKEPKPITRSAVPKNKIYIPVEKSDGFFKKLLYKILKKDMINKLRIKHGDQFVDDVMNTFGMPTNFMDKYFPRNKVSDNMDFDAAKKKHLEGHGEPGLIAKNFNFFKIIIPDITIKDIEDDIDLYIWSTYGGALTRKLKLSELREALKDMDGRVVNVDFHVKKMQWKKN